MNGVAMSHRRESGLKRFLRRLFQADADARREMYGSAAPAPPLHVEDGPAEPRRRHRKRR